MGDLKKRKGKRTIPFAGCHLLCSCTLLPGYSVICYLGVWLSVFQLLSFLLPVLKFLKCSIKLAHQLILSGCRASGGFFACALWLRVISYAFKKEFSVHLLNYASVNELVHDNRPYNLFLIRKIKVSGQNDGMLKNWTLVMKKRNPSFDSCTWKSWENRELFFVVFALLFRIYLFWFT